MNIRTYSPDDELTLDVFEGVRYMSLSTSKKHFQDLPSPSMSRMHFRALANVLQRCKPEKDSIEYAAEAYIWMKISEQLAQICHNFNANFDYYKFLKACDYYEVEALCGNPNR